MKEPKIVLGTVVEPGFKLFGPKKFELDSAHMATHKFGIGTTGTGKSSLIKSIVWQMVQQGIALASLDPHGDQVFDLLTLLVHFDYFKDPSVYDKFWYIEFSDDEDAPAIPFNFLKRPLPPHVIAGNTLEAFHRAFPELAQGAGNFDTLILAGVEVLVRNNLPLPALSALLTDQDVRKGLLQGASPEIVTIFDDWFEKLSKHDQADTVASTLKRVFMLTQNPALRNCLGQTENLIDASYLMDQGITVLYNLKGIRDRTARRYLGSLILLSYEEAALTRPTGVPVRQHHIVIDEAAQFTSRNPEPLMVMLSETRKRGLFVTMVQQSWSQSDIRLQGALQNVGCLICMRVGPADAQIMSRWLGAGTYDPMLIKDEAPTPNTHPIFFSLPEQVQAQIDQLVNLPNRHAIVKLFDRPATLIRAIDVPNPEVDPMVLEQIKDEYRKRLMVSSNNIVLPHLTLKQTYSRHTSRSNP